MPDKKSKPPHPDNPDPHPGQPMHTDVPNTKVDKAVGKLIQPEASTAEGSKK